MVSELTQGKASDALYAGLLTMKNQAVEALGEANQAKVGEYTAVKALNSYAASAEARCDALQQESDHYQALFERAYIEAEI